MKKITIQEIKLRNFKGVTNAHHTLGGANVIVRGTNESGKTTTFLDSLLWLFTDRDSHGRTDFQIKTIGKESEEHSVEVLLEVDGTAFRAKRTLTEKWVKARQAKDAVMEGHTNKYEWDGVPVTKTEFLKRASEALPLDNWSLLTNPLAFANMDWKERRSILLALTGDVTDEDVIAAEPSVARVPELLNGRSVEDFALVLRRDKAAAEGVLSEIPARIDEAKLAGEVEIPTSLDGNVPELEARVAELRAGMAGDNRRDALVAKRERLQTEIFDLKASAARESRRLESDALADVNHARSQLNRATALFNDSVTSVENRLTAARGDYVAQQKVVQQLVETVPAVNAKALSDDVANLATLAEPYAVDDAALKAAIERVKFGGAHDELLESLNVEHAEKLEAARAELEAIKQRGLELAQELEDAKGNDGGVSSAQEALEAAVAAQEELVEVVADTAALEKELEGVEAELTKLEGSDNQQALAAAEKELAAAKQAVADNLAAIKAAEKRISDAAKREEELKAKEVELRAELNELAEHQHLVETFSRVRSELLQGEVNQFFTEARIELFEELVSGGFKEVCTITNMDGVHWNALSTGARVRIGVDILNALQNFYGVRVPVVVDNRESVVALPPIDSQIISLVVDAGAKKLDVEVAA